MERSSKAHARRRFAKNFYDLPLANLLHPGECLESSILPADLKLARVKGSSKAHGTEVRVRKAWLSDWRITYGNNRNSGCNSDCRRRGIVCRSVFRRRGDQIQSGCR